MNTKGENKLGLISVAMKQISFLSKTAAQDIAINH